MTTLVNKRLLGALFPQHCALCGAASGSHYPLCNPCRGGLVPNDSCCHRCALPLPVTGDSGRLCGQCQYHPPDFDRARVPWIYEERLAHLIGRWKYQRQWFLTPLLADLWQQQAVDQPLDQIIPVPLHWRRRWQRGCNQAELLCREWQRQGVFPPGARLGLDLARRQLATAPQSGMDARHRANNLRHAFTVRRPCDNLRVALVDDVLTTGATARALAAALRKAGCGYIEVWCLARTPTPGD